MSSKEWVFSNDQEKMDAKNGFVLTPTFDRLFDRGFISFEDDKTLVVSPWLFEGYSCNCFFRKTDFVEFLEDAESEYLFPQQNYVNKADLPVKYKSLKQLINQYNQEILPFSIYRVNVEPPRVYINSNSSWDYNYILITFQYIINQFTAFFCPKYCAPH